MINLSPSIQNRQSLQHSMCLFGASSSPVLREVLDGWWDANEITRDNLNWRAYLNNNSALIRAINDYIRLQDSITIAENSEVNESHEKVNTMVDLLNKLTGHLSQSNNIIDQLSTRGFPIAMLSISFADLMRRFLAISTTGAAQIIHNRLGNIILAGISEQARELYQLKYNINGVSFKGKPSKGAKKIHAEASKAYKNADLNNTRIAMVVMGFSGYDFWQRIAQGRYQDAREKAELVASFLTTTAAAFQIGISAIESCIGTDPLSKTAITTYNAFGKIFLWGAISSFTAGSMSAVFDFMDYQDQLKKDNSILARAYFTRSIATIALSVSQFLAVLGTLVPWFEGILARSIKRTVWTFVVEIGLYIGRFAIIPGVAAALSIICFYASFIALAATVVIIIFDDDALQKWLDRCCFSKDAERKRFASLTEELTEFHQAIGGTF